MLDLEAQVHRVWSPDVRPLVEEAWRCYNAGAIRASIGQTWVAVCADLTEKILRLSEEGDGDAKAFRAKIEAAQSDGLNASGIEAMQVIERTILETAAKLELIDTITQRDLERLREDRHLCVHPSLRRLGEAYEPRPESARAHLAIALDSLLIHPPTQGRRIVEDFSRHVADPMFSPSPAHLMATFFTRVRPTARRKIVDLAAKHSLLELSGPDGINATQLADRMAACLHAFAHRDQSLVQAALAKSLDRLRPAESGLQLRAAARLGTLDAFWDLVDAPLASRLNDLVESLAPADLWEPLPPAHAEALSLVRVPQARELLPNLQTTFDGLVVHNRASVMARHIDPFFASYVPGLLYDAGGWRQAEELTRTAVVPYGPLLNAELLRQVLTKWADNAECRTAGGMRQLAVELFRTTTHLRSVDQSIWTDFLDRVRAREAAPSLYRYTELEAEMRT